jgi:hypothetical protein
VINRGKLQTNDPNGYIALLAPEVRNQGYILARGGSSAAVALASGAQISLDFHGNQLVSVRVDASVYRSLIVNKRVVEVPGGLVVIAANSAAQLMGSVIKNSGRISSTSMVADGGVIKIVAGTVDNRGVIVANSNANQGSGGFVSVIADTIRLANRSLISASARTQGNGGVITLAARQANNLAGRLFAKGGSISGDGGQIQTLSLGSLTAEDSLSVNAGACRYVDYQHSRYNLVQCSSAGYFTCINAHQCDDTIVF